MNPEDELRLVLQRHFELTKAVERFLSRSLSMPNLSAPWAPLYRDLHKALRDAKK